MNSFAYGATLQFNKRRTFSIAAIANVASMRAKNNNLNGCLLFFRGVNKEVSAGKLSQNTTELFDLAPQIQARIAFLPSQ